MGSAKAGAPALVEWNLLRPDGVYVIHEARRPGEYILKERYLGEHTAPEFSRAPFWIMTMPVMRFNRFLLSHVKKPETQVLQFSETVKDGVKLRQLKVAEKINKFSSVSTFYFHATDEWLLHSFVVDGSQRGMVRYKYQTVGDEQVPERVEVDRIGPDGTSKPRFIYDFESYQRADPPESEFSLEKFGLPESVDFAPRESTPVYVWILVIAAGCAALAFFFRFLARRWRAVTTPN
ncbi:MAG: hypothetical protein L0Z62_18275 [Gemmataceae bacterium]|nr:hypothetical protein [Gemmataceae bacterium]